MKYGIHFCKSPTPTALASVLPVWSVPRLVDANNSRYGRLPDCSSQQPCRGALAFRHQSGTMHNAGCIWGLLTDVKGILKRRSSKRLTANSIPAASVEQKSTM